MRKAFMHTGIHKHVEKSWNTECGFHLNTFLSYAFMIRMSCRWAVLLLCDPEGDLKVRMSQGNQLKRLHCFWWTPNSFLSASLLEVFKWRRTFLLMENFLPPTLTRAAALGQTATQWSKAWEEQALLRAGDGPNWFSSWLHTSDKPAVKKYYRRMALSSAGSLRKGKCSTGGGAAQQPGCFQIKRF